jgi:type I restriction enzyme M protein
MVDRLTNLVAIFENPALEFSKNRAEGDVRPDRVQ